MMKGNKVVVAFIVLVVFACSPKDRDYFGQEVTIVDDIPEIEAIALTPVREYGFNLSNFNVFGNVLISHQNQGESHFILLDIRSGEELGTMCIRGRGPDEFISVLPHVGILGETVSVLDFAKMSYYEINLPKTLAEGRTQIENSCSIEPSRPGQVPYANVHKLPGGKVIFYDFCYRIGAAEPSLEDIPHYAVFDSGTGKMIERYPLGGPNCARYLKEHSSHPFLFYPYDCVSPTGEKLCFVLADYPIYGFIDLQTGARQLYRIAEKKDHVDGELVYHFSGVCTDGSYLFALYQGRVRPSSSEGNTMLYVLTWSGEIKTKYVLPGMFSEIQCSDEVLYLRAEDHLYQIKIQSES